MPNYHRNRVPGGCYFFTANLRDRRSTLLIDQIALLRECVRACLTELPFHIDAWEVLPDHMHCIWTLPSGDADYSGRWLLIKKRFSRSLPIFEPRSPVMIARAERGIWQRRYWEHTIRDDNDYVRHMDYVHFNPVKHGLVPAVTEWPHSTFRRAVAMGLYPAEWAPGGGASDGKFGE